MINIAEKLKNCPNGYKLYSPLFGDVTLNEVTEDYIYVKTFNKYSDTTSASFNIKGQFYTGYEDAECLLFPSRQQRDWSKFKYIKIKEDHRVMVSNNGRY